MGQQGMKIKARQGEIYFILAYLCDHKSKVSKEHGWRLSRKEVLVMVKLYVLSQVSLVTALLHSDDIIMEKAVG